MSRQDISTPYGTIHVSTPGAFSPYDNFRLYKQNKDGTRIVRLQGPALRAFKAAEARCATKRKPIIKITGIGYRSYELQRELWLSDKNRYAHPDGSMHVEGLAVDVDQSVGKLRLQAIGKALRAEGWNPGASFGDIPHWSFKVTG